MFCGTGGPDIAAQTMNRPRHLKPSHIFYPRWEWCGTRHCRRSPFLKKRSEIAQMQPNPNSRPLPERWADAAAADPTVDAAILHLVQGCRTGNSINEAALLKALVAHADSLATTEVAGLTIVGGEATQA